MPEPTNNNSTRRPPNNAALLKKRLADCDLEKLHSSGLTDATIVENELYTEKGALVFRYRGSDGALNGYALRRPHKPRKNAKGQPIKYEAPAGTGPRIYLSKSSFGKLGTARRVYITEGPIKALAIDQVIADDELCIGLNGVWCWKQKGDTDELIAELAALDWHEIEVVFVFDYDLKPETRDHVMLATRRAARLLQAKGAKPARYVRLPPGPNAGKQGIDDYLVAQGSEQAKDAFEKLVDKAEPVERPLPTIWRAADLVETYPKLREPLVEGVLRVGEVANLIGKSKSNKSFTALGLMLAIATGRPWLGKFACQRGKVLLLDNELHHHTLANRIRTVVEAMGLTTEDWQDWFDVVPVRGDLRGIEDLDRFMRSLEPDTYALIVIDAFYRILPDGTTESDNAGMAAVYSKIDSWAALTLAAFLLVHHATKGEQATKDIVDVGSGAGAQSRAADSHLILRHHKDPECVVLEAALRSWAPFTPCVLRWQFPLWSVDDSQDASSLKVPKTTQDIRQTSRDKETDAAVLEKCQGASLTANDIVKETRFGIERVKRAVARLLDAKVLEETIEDRPHRPGSTVYKAVDLRDALNAKRAHHAK